MARACSKCSYTDSTPRNFLLTCAVCSSSFHHRCHLPVVGDHALIALIKASTQGDRNGGLDSWRCAACQRRPPQDLSRPHSRTVPRPPVDDVIDLTLSDSEEDVKPEETTLPLRQLPRYRYNLAPTWMHKRHSDLQTADTADPWDRLSKAKCSHRTKRVGKSAAWKSTARAENLLVFSAAGWFAKRKAMLSRDGLYVHGLESTVTDRKLRRRD